MSYEKHLRSMILDALSNSFEQIENKKLKPAPKKNQKKTEKKNPEPEDPDEEVHNEKEFPEEI